MQDEFTIRDNRHQADSGSTALNGIVGVAMVGIMGGSPRLAVRAARVMLEDSYSSRPGSGRGRLRGRIRSRGE